LNTHDADAGRSAGLTRVAVAAAISVTLAAGLVACNKTDTTAATPDATAAATAANAAPPQPAVSSAVSAMSADKLREAAQKALGEQRLYAPAGDNAMEYYLALRDKTPGDATVAAALTDLEPYTLIATDQAIGRKDFAEANRLYGLLEKTDSAAPALPRLKNAIADGQKAAATQPVVAQTDAEKAKAAELEQKRLDDQKKLQEQAAKELAAKQAADKATVSAAATASAAKAAADKAAADKAAADKAAADRAAADRRAAERAQQPAQQPAAPKPAAASSELHAVSTPPPRFPPAALRSGRSGTVQVEFTVGTDGSVTAAHVVDANPPHVFDSAAEQAVRRWKFQPVGSPVTARRTINFTPQ